VIRSADHRPSTARAALTPSPIGEAPSTSPNSTQTTTTDARATRVFSISAMINARITAVPTTLMLLPAFLG
jgi:hypothetical protein